MMTNRRQWPWPAWLAALLCTAAWAAPQVENPSFEADVYGNGPGYAGGNGGEITGWNWHGGIGLNPYYVDPETKSQPMGPFSDNGAMPDGGQILFVQENGRLSQEIAGFEAGQRYVVTYYENARHNNHPRRNPTVEVRLGDEVVVSRHKVSPVDDYRVHSLPYNRVTSAPFTAPRDGAYTLVFDVHGEAAALLLDQVAVQSADARADASAAEDAQTREAGAMPLTWDFGESADGWILETPGRGVLVEHQDGAGEDAPGYLAVRYRSEAGKLTGPNITHEALLPKEGIRITAGQARYWVMEYAFEPPVKFNAGRVALALNVMPAPGAQAPAKPCVIVLRAPEDGGRVGFDLHALADCLDGEWTIARFKLGVGRGGLQTAQRELLVDQASLHIKRLELHTEQPTGLDQLISK